MKKIALSLAIAASAFLGACSNDAQVASYNLSQDADNFKINRRVVFYNGINGEYLLSIEGYCSIDNGKTGKNAVAVTCKVAEGDFKKHFLSQSDNVTWFAEQLAPAKVSTQAYKVTFKPSVIIPDIQVR